MGTFVPVERLVSRDRLIVLASLAAVAGLAWLWLLRAPMHHPMDAWSLASLVPTFVMWALMMVAMMLPSAAPMILLYARFARHAGSTKALANVGLFASAYLAIWCAFSLAAALLQAWLVSSAAISAMDLAVGNERAAGIILMMAGIYQLTPAKRACLAECRSPLTFVMRLWRPGRAGALRLGVIHGLYCLGCCWALMLLLFVGGVMNLAWIGGLALLVLAEKLAPMRIWIPAVTGIVLVAAGLFLLLD
jgi:predicted metal-binding membrane protein